MDESGGLTKEGAAELLAECLYLKMERMDPNNRGSWDELSESEREFYRENIREILLEKSLITLAMGDSSDLPTTT